MTQPPAAETPAAEAGTLTDDGFGPTTFEQAGAVEGAQSADAPAAAESEVAAAEAAPAEAVVVDAAVEHAPVEQAPEPAAAPAPEVVPQVVADVAQTEVAEQAAAPEQVVAEQAVVQEPIVEAAPPVQQSVAEPVQVEPTVQLPVAQVAEPEVAQRPLVTGVAAGSVLGAGYQPSPPAPPAPPPAAPQPAARPAKARARGPRRAVLQLRHINPWTVFKFACAMSVALFLVWLVVVGLLYGVLDAGGAIDSINRTVTTITPGSTGPITGGRVLLYALLIGAINTVLIIALTTVGTFVYNFIADLVGGIEVTLTERGS